MPFMTLKYADPWYDSCFKMSEGTVPGIVAMASHQIKSEMREVL